MAQVQEIVLSVPDVSCEHCVKTINGALGTLAGVESVSTDIPSKTVHPWPYEALRMCALPLAVAAPGRR